MAGLRHNKININDKLLIFANLMPNYIMINIVLYSVFSLNKCNLLFNKNCPLFGIPAKIYASVLF